MTEREQPSDDTQAPQTHEPAAADLASSAEQEERELSESPGADGSPAAPSTPLSEPAPAVDAGATTPDRDDDDDDDWPSGEGEGDGGSSLANEHPEVLVGAAFAGGLALAVVLRLVGRG